MLRAMLIATLFAAALRGFNLPFARVFHRGLRVASRHVASIRVSGLVRTSLVAVATLFLMPFLGAAEAEASRPNDEPRPPADLRLEWPDGSRLERPVHGEHDDSISIRYQLRNVGAGEAFAVILEAWTDLGRIDGVVRLQPGPAPGARLDRILGFQLTGGMKEICLLARLQTVESTDPRDPSPDDNRLCRPLVVESAPSDEAAAPALFPGRP